MNRPELQIAPRMTVLPGAGGQVRFDRSGNNIPGASEALPRISQSGPAAGELPDHGIMRPETARVLMGEVSRYLIVIGTAVA